METYKYDFSVVMAVYNVEAYLKEAVESLVHQTIGFSRIQLIMVDDGSTDGSGKICDSYRKKYPENIVVVHKENGGVSSARNAGLEFVQGRYLNFMDSDDKLDGDTLSKVKSFFNNHALETDVATIPIRVFDGWNGGNEDHNSKFDLEGEVIDLYKNPFITNYSASTSFFIADSIKGIIFDERLSYGEDAKFVLEVLFGKMKIGLIRNTAYWYRSRSGNDKSATQSIMYQQAYYLPYITYFSKWALDESKKLFLNIPKFVQYEVLFHLQRRLNSNRIPENVLSQTDEEEYWRLLVDIVCKIDVEVIMKMRFLRWDRKFFFLKQIYGYFPEKIKVANISDKNNNLRLGEVELRYGDFFIENVSNMKTVWEFIKYDSASKEYTFEGYHLLYGIDSEYFIPTLLVNGETFFCEEIDRTILETEFLGERVSKVLGFRGKFSLKKKKNIISTALIYDGIIIQRTNIHFGNFFPLSAVYKNAYAIIGNSMIDLLDGNLKIELSPTKSKQVKREIGLLREIWYRNLLGGRKAVGGRMYYHLLKPFKKKKLWIVSDRIMKADDNGEAFFVYLQKHKPANTRVIFAINKRSADYQRLSRIGEVVSAMSFRHKLLHLLCDVNISSQADNVTVNPFDGHHEALRDLLIDQKFVFLQHGIILHDLSEWLNKYNKNITGFLTSAVSERKSIVEGKYGYPSSTVWLTGLPRYDRLSHKEEKIVTIMPTWRRFLTENIDSQTGIWSLISGFEETDYYRFYNSLLNSERLLEALSELGYRLQFFPHPNLQPHIERFEHDSRVSFLSLQTSYREVYAKSNLIVTDYSSAMFDFAYLKKPIIYCQFDKDVFFGGTHTLGKGYFNYDRDGFGEITTNLDETINMVIQYARNGCLMKNIYKKRVDEFFAFNDTENCARVLKKILEIS